MQHGEAARCGGLTWESQGRRVRHPYRSSTREVRWVMRVSSVAAAVALFILLPGSLPAQTAFTVSLGRAFNSLSEGGIAESRQNTAARVSVEQRAADARLRLYYHLDSGSYTTPGDWTYYLHSAGGTWKFGPKPEEGKPAPLAVYAGGFASLRSNGTSWAAADYRAITLFANVQRQPLETVVFRAGYRFDLRDFPDSPELDQREHDVFASLLLNFPSRTTVVAEAHAGAKDYRGGGVAPVPMPQYPEPGGAAGGSLFGAGSGFGRRAQPASYMSVAQSAPTPGTRASQLNLLVRLAQSLADRTGLSLQLAHRSTFGGLPAAVVTTPALFFDDGVYDDPFASNANTVRGTLKHVRSSGLELELQGVWMDKDYRGTRALEFDGVEMVSGELRADRILRAGAGVNVPLFSSRTAPLALSLDVDYWFTRHRSNDLFYNYRSHGAGVGFSVSY